MGGDILSMLGDLSTSINKSTAACGLLMRSIYLNLRGCIVWKKTAKTVAGISSRRVACRFEQRHMRVI